MCPPSSLCIDDTRCVPADALTVCASATDGMSCTTSEYTGTCIAGVCTVPVCGDGIIEGSEQCDGPVTDVDCVQFGYDTGLPTCTPRCDLDVIDSCTRFGWQPFAPLETFAMWTDGTTIIASSLTSPDQVTVMRGGQILAQRAGHYVSVSGSPTEMFANDYQSIVRWASGASLDPIALPPGETGKPDRLVVDGSGRLDVLFFPGCEVQQRDTTGTWTQLRAPDGNVCTPAIAATGDDIVIAGAPSTTMPFEVWRWHAGAWTVEASGLDIVIAIAPLDSVTWVGSVSALTRIEGGQVTTYPVSGSRGIVPFANGTYLMNGATPANGAARVEDGHIEIMPVPVTGNLFGDASGKLYAYGSGVYVYTGIEFGAHSAIGVVDDLVATPNGDCIAAQGGNLTFRSDDGGWNGSGEPIQPHQVAVRADGELVATDGAKLLDCTASGCGVSTPPGFQSINDLWAPPSNEPSVFAVGANSISLERVSTTWSPVAAPVGDAECTLNAISGNASATVVATVGDCGGVGVVWQLAPGGWTETYRGGSSFAAVAVTDDGEVFACGAVGGIHTTHGVWSVDPQVACKSMSATTSSDVFAAGNGQVLHWDGTVWSRINVVGLTDPRVAATPHVVYFSGAETSVLLR
jgi:hypothetical protein